MLCGRGPNGDKKDKCSVCPVTTEILADGLNGGVNGGRMCWVIVDNCPGDENDSSRTQEKSFCFQCEFRYKVMAEEGLLNSCTAIGSYLTSVRLTQKKK